MAERRSENADVLKHQKETGSIPVPVSCDLWLNLKNFICLSTITGFTKCK